MNVSNIRSRRRVVTITSAIVMVASVLVGCTAQHVEEGKPSMDPDVAKQKMIDAVNDVIGRLGGQWKPRTGPDAPESCQLSNGQKGAHWVYLTGSADGGDPEPDAAATKKLWRSQGMAVERWADPDGPVIVGRGGGSVDSINLYAFPGNYTVEAISLCFPGDADRL
ncbi:hypothetical protein [Curtobacterium sp. VKM Ac-2922]|uniref:hypothetical protein n=1 Tax=Curtobacterium sp. VKM Ac-2922 TaxID=2929475 RepID=UPI001FB33AF0|nr:hypothetical protein [Curtobacterium sp. VKM Ac-2922]MCJ1713411.1 hypothetical protein [Curtobacterium sp. VKM Ac-2922]